MTSSDSDPARSTDGDHDASDRGPSSPLLLVARIAESLPELNESELDELADAVESLTEAIGLRIDWLYDGPAAEPGDAR